MSAHKHRNGGARISTTPWSAVENRTTPTRTSRPSLSAGFVTGFVAVLFGVALAAAAPAAAADDPTRPDARVTHGPSCRPGGLVVEVVAGTSPYSVRLATTRTPSGEDEATLQPGQTVVLHTDDVAYGETIDGRLEFAAQDGTGVTYVDELVDYSFTRPSKEDCDAIADPSPTDSGSAPSSSGSAPTTSDSGAPTASGAETPTAATTTDSRSPAPGGSAPTVGGGDASPQQVTAGDTVTLQAGGFLPGELVTIQLHGSDEILATATAGPDGTVQTDVRIPGGTDAGATTVHLTGTQSEVVADVELQVAAAETPLAPSGSVDIVPLAAAAVALVAAAGFLFSVVGRPRGGRPTIRRA
jgi:hypothetical protein